MCSSTLVELQRTPYSSWFMEPVDPTRIHAPRYFEIVSQPMDFSTISQQLQRNKYSSPLDFVRDVRLTFANALKYN
eukprot:jgi/Bigna1/36463/e_gw1.14.226.1